MSRAWLLATLTAVVGVAVVVSPVSGGTPPGQCFGETPTVLPSAPDRGLSPIQGTSGDDVISGTPGPDRINGRGGKDLICGGKGDDLLKGGGRDDKLNGQGDDDVVIGGTGDDKHTGGPDEDTIRANTGKPGEIDIAKGSDGDDNIETLDGAGGDVANGGDGTNTCAIDPGDQFTSCQNLTD